MDKLDELKALLSELPALTVVQHCKAGGDKPVDTVKLDPIQRRALGSMERQHGEAIVAAVNWCRDEGIALARQRAEQSARVVALEAALRFYGGHDPDNSDHGDWFERMNEDGGDVARAALTGAA